LVQISAAAGRKTAVPRSQRAIEPACSATASTQYIARRKLGESIALDPNHLEPVLVCETAQLKIRPPIIGRKTAEAANAILDSFAISTDIG
jgi:hypothetical protein